MNYELRVLSGLHRGATLPLDEETLLIGASDDAGVVLVDPGIEEQHAVLSRSDDGWLALPKDGSLFGLNDTLSQSMLDLSAGHFFRLGMVWMVISRDDAPWQEAPPIPQAVAAAMASDEEEELDDEPAFASEINSAEDLYGEGLHDDDGLALEEAEAPVEAKPASGKTGKAKRILFIPLGILAVLSAAGAYAISSKPEMPLAPKKIEMPSDLRAPGNVNTTRLVDKDLVSNNNGANASSSNQLTGSALREAFRKRLSDAELLKRFDLKLEDDAWEMRADLDDAETKRFERVLKNFIDKYQITFPVNAKIVTAEGMLPFKIRQVVSGANASVMTVDGTRLYIGDEYQGVKLVSIKGNALVFAGKRKIEMVW